MTIQQVQLFLGGTGFDRITNTTAYKPLGCEWYVMIPEADTVINSVTMASDHTLNGAASTTPLNGATLKFGDMVYGAFTSVQLTSGSVRMVRKLPGQI